MRIGDNPNITSGDADKDDILLLTHTPNGTGTNDNKDRRFRLAALAAWVSANLVSNITLLKNSPFLTFKSSNIAGQIGKTIPENNTSLGGSEIKDMDDERAFYSEVIKTKNDDLYKSFILRRLNAAGTAIVHGFYMHITADGTPSVTFSSGSKDAWMEGLGAVPTSRTVNGHALTGNVTVTASDLGVANTVVNCSCTQNTAVSGTNTVLGDTGTLSPGTYIILAGGCWKSIATTKNYSIHLTNNSNGSGAISEAHVTNGPGNGDTYVQLAHLVSITSNTKFYFACWQNSGADVTFSSPYLKYVKLHN